MPSDEVGTTSPTTRGRNDMSGLMNLVSRFTRGATTTGRKPHARPGHRPVGARGMGGAPRGRGGAGSLEGTARRLIRRAR